MEIRIKIPDFNRKNMSSWWNRAIASLTINEPQEEVHQAKKQVLIDNKKMKKEVNEFLASRQKLKDKKEKKEGLGAAGSNTKIKVQKEDLKLISTALVRYGKFLTQNKQLEKAERVRQLDSIFFKIISGNKEQAQGRASNELQPDLQKT